MGRALAFLLMFAIAFVSAVAAQQWKPYTVYVPPDRNIVAIKVRFEPITRVRVLCSGAVGCLKGTQNERGEWIDPPLIIAPVPESFNDKYALLILGHETLHALGAYHD